MKKIYPKSYVNVMIKSNRPSEFFNDCEGNVSWDQMKSLSADKSFSGKKSSKTGQKQDFSVTFKCLVKNLPDSLKQILIDFQLFQTDIKHKAKLIVEISGKNIDYQWYGFLITDLSKTVKKWNKINYKFTLPDNFYQADRIKIYVYNPSGSIIYVDDIGIKFFK